MLGAGYARAGGQDGVVAAVGQVEVGHGAPGPVAYDLGRVGDECGLLAEQGGGGEQRGFGASALHGLSRVFGLGGVDAAPPAGRGGITASLSKSVTAMAGLGERIIAIGLADVAICPIRHDLIIVNRATVSTTWLDSATICRRCEARAARSGSSCQLIPSCSLT